MELKTTIDQLWGNSINVVHPLMLEELHLDIAPLEEISQAKIS